MPNEVTFSPDATRAVFNYIVKLMPEEDREILYLHHLPDGYNPDKSGVAVVVMDDASQVNEHGYTRQLVRVNVYGSQHELVRRLGRSLFTALTSGVAGVGLGVSRRRSFFFGSAPSYKPSGFVSTMSISVGMSNIFYGG